MNPCDLYDTEQLVGRRVLLEDDSRKAKGEVIRAYLGRLRIGNIPVPVAVVRLDRNGAEVTWLVEALQLEGPAAEQRRVCSVCERPVHLAPYARGGGPNACALCGTPNSWKPPKEKP